jgi:RimJ/RimL family protein N-acetyltransferase
MDNPAGSRPDLRPDVRLAGVGPEHANAMYRWMCDPEVSLNLGLRHEPSPERTLAWIRAAASDPSTRPFAILVDGRHVGNVVLDRIDEHLASARLSVYIGEASARGGGVGTTAIALALREGFGPMGLNKIWLTVHSRNFAAISVYSRLGFALEGILRDEFVLDHRRVPALYMGLLRSEFERFDSDARDDRP